MIVTALAGYVTPPLLGLGAAGMLASGHITALLWLSILLLGAILLAIRNVYGVLSIVTTGAVIFVVSWYTSATVQAAFAYGSRGSCCWRARGRSWSCRPSAPVAARPTRTPTSSPASPVCPDSCGCSASAGSLWRRCWRERGSCHPRCRSFRAGDYFFSIFSPFVASTTNQEPPNELRP